MFATSQNIHIKCAANAHQQKNVFIQNLMVHVGFGLEKNFSVSVLEVASFSSCSKQSLKNRESCVFSADSDICVHFKRKFIL